MADQKDIVIVHAKSRRLLLDAALAYPEAWEDHPWGESVAKVGKKLFFTISFYKEKLYITFKLPESGESALTLPFASPSGYGLGKHGWVTCTFASEDTVPIELLLEWMDESYRTIAPKKLVALLDQTRSNDGKD